jgi:phosphate/sulfate permease
MPMALLTILAMAALVFANGANDVSKGIATLAGSGCATCGSKCREWASRRREGRAGASAAGLHVGDAADALGIVLGPNVARRAIWLIRRTA